MFSMKISMPVNPDSLFLAHDCREKASMLIEGSELWPCVLPFVSLLVVPRLKLSAHNSK